MNETEAAADKVERVKLLAIAVVLGLITWYAGVRLPRKLLTQ